MLILLIALLCPVLCIIFRLNRMYQFDKETFNISQRDLIMLTLGKGRK